MYKDIIDVIIVNWCKLIRKWIRIVLMFVLKWWIQTRSLIINTTSSIKYRSKYSFTGNMKNISNGMSYLQYF